MEITTIQKFMHTSPRKLRLVADMVRNMKPAQAMSSLQFTNKAAAKTLIKAINTVMANAKQQNLETDRLVFKKLEVNEGPRMKRFRAQARGRVSPYQRKMSHIKIVLSDDLTQNSKLKTQKLNSKKEERPSEILR